MRIVHLDELSFTDHELRKIPREELAVLIVLGHIANELAALQRLTYESLQNSADAPEIDDACRVYLLFLARSLAARLIEASETLDGAKSSLRVSGCAELFDVLNAHTNDHRSYKKSAYFKIANNVRNKLTSHYDLEAVSRALGKRDRLVPFKGYLARLQANCFYPFSEDWFSGIFIMEQLEGRDLPVTSKTLGEWLIWGQDFAGFFQTVMADYVKKLVRTRLPGKEPRKVSPYCPPQHFVTKGDGAPPLFVDASREVLVGQPPRGEQS